MITKIKINIDEKKYVLGLFIDLKKAFDTVSHRKLLTKLYDVGIRGTAFLMLESYLTDRRQVVKIDQYVSSTQTVACGIPQGSILGPLLFLIYVNSIAKLGLKGHLTLYADDTCLFYFGKDFNNKIRDAQEDLDVLNEWMLENLLTINTTKNFIYNALARFRKQSIFRAYSFS
jgi:retron-type reverse transcriptase